MFGLIVWLYLALTLHFLFAVLALPAVHIALAIAPTAAPTPVQAASIVTHRAKWEKFRKRRASAQHDDGSSRRGYHKCQSQTSYRRAPLELGYGRVVREDGLL